MTDKKIRALFLSALMVFSVIALSGAGAAANRGAGNATYDTGPTDNSGTDSEGDIGDGETIFQGEEGITFVDGGSEVSPASLERTAGSNEGVPLQVPVPQDQATGSYSVDPASASAFSVTVQSPRITTLEVQNNDGADVSGGVLTTDQTSASVFVEYNYQSAEDVTLTVEDEDGLDVTSEIVTGSDARNGDGAISIDPSSVDEGEYTFTVEGTDDLDFGEASQSVVVNISSDQTASIDLAESELTQGEDNQVTINNSPEGNFHALVIESSDFRDGLTREDAGAIFRNVGDTSETGVLVDTGSGSPTAVNNPSASAGTTDVQYAYAIVEIDGGNGVSSIESQYLDDSSVTVDLYPAAGSVTPNYVNNGGHIDADLTSNFETDDSQDFDVTEGEVSLNSPTGTYITGSSVNVSGDANPGVDEVAIYVRDNNDFQHVPIDGSPTISVDSDDTFEEEDVELSASSNILQFAGSYRIGVIDAQDADVDGTAGVGSSNVDPTLTTSDFNSGVSATSSLRVTDTALNGSFITYNNQVSSDDNSIDIEGAAPGKDSVAVVFVGERGEALVYDVSVDDDGTFSEEDLSLGSLSEGTITGHIISSGRDNTFGAGIGDISALQTEVNGYASGTASGDQVRAQIIANTVDDTGSDDLIVNSQFRKTDSLTTIESVNSPVEGDGTLTVVGETNRVPDDTTITVEVLNEDEQSVAIDSTDQWNSTGTFTVTLDLEDLEPGNYTVEADDGDNTDRASIEVVENVEEPSEPTPSTEEPTPSTEEPTPSTEEPTPSTEEPTEEMTTEMEMTEEEEATEAGNTEAEETTTGGSGPGFTAAIALIALIAAALLAVRRNN